MKLSEYVLNFFKSKGIDKVFLVNGGSIAFLIDAFRKVKNINYVCAVHEQGAAMMADGYARTKKKTWGHYGNIGAWSPKLNYWNCFILV